MLSGLKFIPRDQLNTDLGSSEKERKRSGGRKEKRRRKKKSSYTDSSSDEGTEKIKKSSKKSKKWYSSDESMSSSSSESESDSHSNENKHRNSIKEKKTKENSSKEASHKLKKREKRKKRYASESYSSSEGEHEERGSRKRGSNRRKGKGHKSVKSGNDLSEESGGSAPHNEKELARKEMGLEWMLKPANNPERMPIQTNDLPEEPQVDEVKKPNPRELNPYFKDDGDGYPEDSVQTKAGGSHLPSSSVVGDGGASWRLKALKRAQEQAARDGRKLEEVVGERWGSVGQLAVSAAARAAPIRAHLHAINDRKRMVAKNQESASDNQVNLDSEEVRGERREYLRDISLRRPEMREPKVHDSLSWRKRKGQVMSNENAKLISAATSSINKFANDGSFMHDVACHHNKDADNSSRTNFEVADTELGLVTSEASKPTEESPNVEQTLSANQLAAKAMQLRMKGKPDEADKLLKEIEIMKTKQNSGSKSASQGSKGSANRYAMQELSVRKKDQEEDADRHLAQTIMQNKRFSISGQADDEYDFDDAPSRKRTQKRVGQPEQVTKTSSISRRIMTQQERCQFCFESASRRNHLDVSLANFTYLMLPPWQPVVQGHCCILPTQHDSATRTVDNYVWEEIRNFKKCLIKMFAAQEKDVVFLETVMGLAQQRRHCLVECIPLPQEIARQAPLYFKKAIDEAEDEWSQHNAKKLIDTSEKGLRASIPKDFPYFHVEFGLNKGFVHVIDDEKQFKSNLGLNVIRGMLQLPEEDMYRRGKYDSVESQKQAVASFKRDWEPFDWTKQLN